MTDLAAELSVIEDVALKAVSVLGRLAKRTGNDDLAAELELLFARTVEVIELEQLREES